MAKTNKSAGGIGESKNFGAPEGERLQGGVDRILACHINKVLIADMNLDPAVLSALDWFATDEGEAEKRANPDARPASGIEMGADEFSKALEQRKDDVKQRDVPLFEARDPLKEVADRYAKPGMKAKFLSRTRIKDEGGTGMHEVVVKENGDPVMVVTILLHLSGDHTADTVAAAMIEAMRELPDHLRRSITWDRGSEMANWKQIHLDLNTPVYFCDPHSPWQRGSNENTNRLLRFWFEKGTDLSAHTKADLKRVQDKLNSRPRPTLDLDTPAQRLATLISQAA